MENRTREVLKSMNIRHKDLAKKLGFTVIAMSQMLNKPQPKISTLEAVAKAIGVPTWKLFLTDEEINEIVAESFAFMNSFQPARPLASSNTDFYYV